MLIAFRSRSVTPAAEVTATVPKLLAASLRVMLFAEPASKVAVPAMTSAALLSIPGYPFWSLAIFAIDILIIYGLSAYGGSHRSMV